MSNASQRAPDGQSGNSGSFTTEEVARFLKGDYRLPQRMQYALRYAGLNVAQAAKKLVLPRELLKRAVETEETSLNLHDLVAFAQLCQVDPRWLSRGIPSPAAEATIAGIRKLRADRQGNFDRMSPRDFGTMLLTFRVWPQPELAEAEIQTCRYCGCTPAMACAEGCEWVDAEETICSACLLSEDE